MVNEESTVPCLLFCLQKYALNNAWNCLRCGLLHCLAKNHWFRYRYLRYGIRMCYLSVNLSSDDKCGQ
jgi:hypothetical protein